MKYLNILALISLIIISSCSFNNENQEVPPIQQLNIPDDFEFSMDKDVDLQIELENNIGNPVQDVVFDIFYVNSEGDYKFLQKAKTNSVGKISQSLNVPAYVTKLYITGFMNSTELDIINGTASYAFSPSGNTRGGDFLPPPESRSFSYLDGISYNDLGVPSPLENNVIDPELLARIGTSLPEHYNLQDTHPEYIDDDIQPNLELTDDADVWITFVSEGASYKNALGFYTYDTAAGPPADPASLDLTIVYPNCSFVDSGGGMESGMKIYLGQFSGGTSMGWFLVRDGWIEDGTVSEDSLRYYSDMQYNPEASWRLQHSVLLYDSDYNTFVMGFEDKGRAYGDNDFNDAVFLADATPVEHVNLTNIPALAIPPDTDGDGVSDPLDDYPDDPDRAFNNYYPNEDDFGTLVFEDLWPIYGDYDMNDMVMDYQYQYVTNANGEIKDMNSNFILRAIGAMYDNGFALQLPFDYSNVSLAGSSSNVSASLVNQDPLLVDIFSGTTDLSGGTQQTPRNTFNEEIFKQPYEIFVNLTLTTPVTLASLEFSFPFNPFIFQQRVQAHEIHLMDYPPTARVDINLFGTEDDASIPSLDHYYRSITNLPWALNMPETWRYPAEKNSITDTYYHFAEWAESGGTVYEDWYLYTEENVNMDKVYLKP